jgi:hypothetical protein
MPDPPPGVPLSEWARGKNGQLLATRGEVWNLLTIFLVEERRSRSWWWRTKRWAQRQWARTKRDLDDLGLAVEIGSRRNKPLPPEVDEPPKQETLA